MPLSSTSAPLPLAERAKWLSDLMVQFESLKGWIQNDAYPVLATGPLGKEEEVLQLPVKLGKIEVQLQEPRPVPVVIVGETGVGKSTLLNSLLDTEILPTGVIGSQTAAFVTISYRSEWRVACRYTPVHELDQLFRDAYAAGSDANEGGAGELADRAGKKLRALLIMEGDQALPDPELVEPKLARFRDLILAGEREFSGPACQEQLTLHAQGHLWPLTREIDVEGPFEMLKSGVVISDLPGAGDMNTARVNQSARAIEHAGQILIAAETKGLKQSLLEQLSLNRLPHRLLRDKEPVQVVLVGTKLDSSLPDPEIQPEEIRKLGLDPADEPSDQEIFRAVCGQWSEFIKRHFATWLRTSAEEILAGSSPQEREAQLNRILERTLVAPTSSRDWKRISRGKSGKYCDSPASTGVPFLRSVLEGLADEQSEATRRVFAQQIAELELAALSAVERSETLLEADIEGILQALSGSQEEMMEVQDRYAQQVEDLRVSILERFRGIRENIGLRIRDAALTMRDRSQQRVRHHLSDPTSLHWMSLKATVRSGGTWYTNSGRVVNLRDAIGGEITALVPQAWQTVADEKLAAQTERAERELLEGLRAFCDQIRDSFFAACDNEMSRRAVSDLLQASQKRAHSEIRDRAHRVQALRENTAKDMQSRIDNAVDESIASICEDCMEDSGRGWNMRSRARIEDGTREVAKKAETRSLKVAEQALAEIETAIVDFCAASEAQMREVATSLPGMLQNAYRLSRLAHPEEMRSRLRDVASMCPRVSQLGVSRGIREDQARPTEPVAVI